MIRLVARATVALLFAGLSAAFAADAHSVHCVLSAGGSFPLSSRTSQASMGFQFGGGVAVDLSHSLVLVPKAEYYLLDKKGGLSDALLIGPDLVIGRRPLPKHASAFFLFGGGLGFPGEGHSVGYGGYGSTGMGTKIYFDVGAGFQIATSQKCAIIVSARYVNIQTNKSAYALLPITLGIKFP